ncbi:preprotein translocase subunit SecG [Pendulispora rubella]|uniref:Protein-export membrane protein SecG n=1 Tax=Pendulispora rubella TaxID=2741070 RepID=A0ABZ2LB59_9BACT
MQSSILETLLQIVHVFVCLVLMFVVLLQQGRGGGMGAAFGGGAAAQVFGGRGAGNILTRATSICAAIFMLTSVSLAYLSSSGDRSLRAKAASEDRKRSERGTARSKEDKPAAPKEEAPPAGGPTGASGPGDHAPAAPASSSSSPQ